MRSPSFPRRKGAIVALVVGLVAAFASPAAAAPPDYLTYTTAISCPSQTECFVVGGRVDLTDKYPPIAYIAATNTGGHTWWMQQAPSTVGPLDAVACPSVEDCYAVGDGQGYQPGQTITATTDAGRIWTQQALPPGAADLAGLSALRCPTVERCYATGNDQSTDTVGVVTTSDGGAHWTYEPGPNLVYISDLSCPGPATCFAGGSAAVIDPNGDYRTAAVAATFDGGARWVTQLVYAGRRDSSYSTSAVGSMTCPTAVDCLAVGSGIWGTTDSGHAWSLRTSTGITDEPEPETEADCPRVADCYVDIDQQLEVSTNGGWTYTQPAYNASPSLVGLSCPAYFRCYGTDGYAALTTNDSARTWTTEALPDTS